MSQTIESVMVTVTELVRDSLGVSLKVIQYSDGRTHFAACINGCSIGDEFNNRVAAEELASRFRFALSQSPKTKEPK